MNRTISGYKPGRWLILGVTALFMVGCAIVLPVAAPVVPKLPGRWPEFLIGAVACFWAFALTVLFVRRERIRLGDVGVGLSRRSVPHLVSAFLAGLLLVGLWASISAAAGYVRWARASEVGFASMSASLIVYLVLSCREELAFRGYPLRRLEGPFGIWGAQLIVAMVFAAEHRAGGWPWTQALFGSGVGSLLFGMAAIATRGLAVPIGLHAAWNFGHWALGMKGEPGVWKAVVEEGRDGHAQLIGTISYLVVMGSATLAFWLWHRRMRQAPCLQHPDGIG
jgi:membrane protease YdiL (CAAX protease family)